MSDEGHDMSGMMHYKRHDLTPEEQHVLWQQEKQEIQRLAAQVWDECTEAIRAMSGASGSESGVKGSGHHTVDGVVYPDDWDASEYAGWSDQVNATQAERMAHDEAIDEAYAAADVERMAREADERANDH